jgi:hypothetical protein
MEFAIHAKIRADRDSFEKLDVAQALDGAEEEIVEENTDEIIFTVYRRVTAESEDEARELASRGRLLKNISYSVEEVLGIRNLSEGL